MKDTSWIKTQLKQCFNGKYDWLGFEELYREKIARFNGKLYKYYSFSEKDSNHALGNFENNIIYFSKPEIFNDPFDCIMGLSIDDLAHSFIMPLVNESIGVNDKNSEVVKQALESLLFEEKEVKTDDPTIELLQLILGAPSFVGVWRKAKNKENIAQEEIVGAFMQAFAEPEFRAEFYTLISNPEAPIDLGQAMKGDKITALIQPILKNQELLTLFCGESSDVFSSISAIKSQKGIMHKLSAVAEMAGQDVNELNQQTAKAETALVKAVGDFKQKINELIGVTCFSERPDNILMWSHYANRHTGFCVEYDFSKLKSIEARLMLFPVIYSKKRPMLPMELFDFSDVNNVKLAEGDLPIPEIIEAMLTKSDIWNYEEEWRIVCFLKNLNGQKLVENMASKVYLGVNIKEKDEEKICAIANKKGILVEKFVSSADAFELKVKHVKTS